MSEIILWSGGMDSTLLLHQLASGNPTDMINAITVVGFGATGNQNKMELIARKKIKKKLKKFKNILYHEIKINSEINNEGWQMPIWLSAVLLSVRNKDNVNIAYLDSDGRHFWDGKQRLIDAFFAFLKLRNIDASIKFPYEYYNKGYVIKELKKLKLFDDCWYCGKPNKRKPCGKCMKCFDVKRWGKFPDEGEHT